MERRQQIRKRPRQEQVNIAKWSGVFIPAVFTQIDYARRTEHEDYLHEGFLKFIDLHIRRAVLIVVNPVRRAMVMAFGGKNPRLIHFDRDYVTGDELWTVRPRLLTPKRIQLTWTPSLKDHIRIVTYDFMNDGPLSVHFSRIIPKGPVIDGPEPTTDSPEFSSSYIFPESENMANWTYDEEFYIMLTR